MLVKMLHKKGMKLLDRFDLRGRKVDLLGRGFSRVKPCQDQQQLQHLDADISAPDGRRGLVKL